MEVSKLNTVLKKNNKLWARNVLSMQLNGELNFDLVDNYKAVKLSFTSQNGSSFPLMWALMEYNIRSSNPKPLYWGLGIYQTDKIVEESQDKSKLEDIVKSRELYLLSKESVDKYAISPNLELLRRNSNYKTRCFKYESLPKIAKSYDVVKGKVHITEGVPLDLFQIN